MSPARFYDPFYQDKYTIASQAIVDYDYMKNYGMNFPSWWKYKDEPKDRL